MFEFLQIERGVTFVSLVFLFLFPMVIRTLPDPDFGLFQVEVYFHYEPVFCEQIPENLTFFIARDRCLDGEAIFDGFGVMTLTCNSTGDFVLTFYDDEEEPVCNTTNISELDEEPFRCELFAEDFDTIHGLINVSIDTRCDRYLGNISVVEDSGKYIQFTSFYKGIDVECNTNLRDAKVLLTQTCYPLEVYKGYDTSYFRNYIGFGTAVGKAVEFYCDENNMAVAFYEDENCEDFAAIYRNDINKCYREDEDPFHFKTFCHDFLPYDSLGIETSERHEPTECVNNGDLYFFYHPNECIEWNYTDYDQVINETLGLYETEVFHIRGECDEGNIVLHSFFEEGCTEGSITITTDSSEYCHEEYLFHCFYLTCFEISVHDEENVCSGNGVCVDSDVCNCITMNEFLSISPDDDPIPYGDEKAYGGDKCDVYMCHGILETDPIVCSEHGDCVAPQRCVCDDETFSGDQCETYTEPEVSAPVEEWYNDFMYYIFGGSGAVIVSGTALAILICCISSCLVCMCILWILCYCSCCVFAIFLCYFRLRIKQKKFESLEDFDLLLQEQKASRDGTKPKFNIDKKMFEIQYSEITLKNQIGKGGSGGTVFLASWRGQDVAFKVFNVRGGIQGVGDDMLFFEEFEREVGILSSISHPNILQFYGCTLKLPRIGIVMEYCENGDLGPFIRRNSDLEFEERKRLVREIISGMTYLHRRDIMHRDIKAENVLINSVISAKIIDFGLSRVIAKKDSNMTARIGTLYTMAPEVFSGKRYGKSADVFSFAMVFYLVMTSKDPYHELDLEDRNRIHFLVASDPNIRPKIPDDILKNEEWQWINSCMQECWRHDPHKRPTFEELDEIFTKEEFGGLKGSVSDKNLSSISGSSSLHHRGNNLSGSLRKASLSKSGVYSEKFIRGSYYKMKDENEKLIQENEKLRERVDELLEICGISKEEEGKPPVIKKLFQKVKGEEEEDEGEDGDDEFKTTSGESENEDSD